MLNPPQAYADPYDQPENDPYSAPPEGEQEIDTGDEPLTLEEYTLFLQEMEQHPPWKKTADIEMDYGDGNQLDTELLRAQAELGIPPAKEDLIGPTLLAIQGYEATVRTDWRVTPNGQPGGQDVADALNFKLNEAERHSKADRACSGAFRPQIAVGLGWVEVAREADPFKYRYRCTPVHRNEIDWDFYAADDLHDARYIRRRRWMQASRLEQAFPHKKALIRECGKHGSRWWQSSMPEEHEGGSATGLQPGDWRDSRGWTVQEYHWYNAISKEVCLAEVWYRRWVSVVVLRWPGTERVVEYDDQNQQHNYELAAGLCRAERAVVTRVRRSYWLGPHCLHDGASPYPHDHFPYVPFWGFREDATKVPYGYVRGMMFQQDRLNSGTALMQWGMAAYRVERTEHAVAMTDEQFRKQVGRRNADIKLNPAAMAQQGARFEVKRDVQLTDQQLQMLGDARAAIERISAAPAAFAGQRGSATSGLQEQTQVEQANQALGHVMDNFRAGRTMVGEMLLAMITEDMGKQPSVVVIEGDAITADRQVIINQPEVNPATGETYLSNDLQGTRLMVALEDVPSSASYRGQQLNAMSEAVKSLPPQFQAAAMPFLASLMDVPFKRDLVEALRAASQQETPEQIEQRVQQAAQDAVAKSGAELKARELDMKELRNDAEIKKLMAQAVQVGVQAAFSAMQAGAQVAQMPMIAPIADQVMAGAGYERPNPMGDDPNFPTPEAAAAMQMRNPYVHGEGAQLGSEQVGAQQLQANEMAQQQAEQAAPVQQNTSPAFPPVPQDVGSPMQGIETPAVGDNLTA